MILKRTLLNGVQSEWSKQDDRFLDQTLHPCLSSYSIVTSKRKTLQIARICRYEAHRRQNTAGKANLRLFRDFSGYFEPFGNSHTFPI